MGTIDVEKTVHWHLMVRSMGSDPIATRAANCLHRSGFHSFQDLAVLQEKLGTPGFRSRVMDIRGFGRTALSRLEDALARYRSGDLKEPPPPRRFPSLPPGLVHRLMRTVEDFGTFPNPEQRVLPEVRDGLTVGDLRALMQMLHGF